MSPGQFSSAKLPLNVWGAQYMPNAASASAGLHPLAANRGYITLWHAGDTQMKRVGVDHGGALRFVHIGAN